MDARCLWFYGLMVAHTVWSQPRSCQMFTISFSSVTPSYLSTIEALLGLGMIVLCACLEMLMYLQLNNTLYHDVRKIEFCWALGHSQWKQLDRKEGTSCMLMYQANLHAYAHWVCGLRWEQTPPRHAGMIFYLDPPWISKDKKGEVPLELWKTFLLEMEGKRRPVVCRSFVWLVELWGVEIYSKINPRLFKLEFNKWGIVVDRELLLRHEESLLEKFWTFKLAQWTHVCLRFPYVDFDASLWVLE